MNVRLKIAQCQSDSCTRADIKLSEQVKSRAVSMTRTDLDNAINRHMHTTQHLVVRYAVAQSNNNNNYIVGTAIQFDRHARTQ